MSRITISAYSIFVFAIVLSFFPISESEARMSSMSSKAPNFAPQTVAFEDDFSTDTDAAWISTGALGASQWSVFRSGNDWGARRNTSPEQLELSNDTSSSTNLNGWAYASVPFTSFDPAFNPKLGSNTDVVTWQFNMRQIATDPGPLSASNGYAAVFVLAANTTTPDSDVGDRGYAVVLGESGDLDPIHLVRFNSGLHGTVTPIIDSNTAGLTDFGSEYLSVKVTYNPATDEWELLLRNDGSRAFADPGSGTLVSQGTNTDSTYAATAFTNMGAYWQGAGNANQTAFFDNVRVSVGQASNIAPVCTAAIIQGAVGTPQYTLDVDDVCTDSDGTIQSVGIVSASGGTALVNAATHVLTFTPTNPNTPASYGIAYSVTDDGSAAANSTVTIVANDPPNATTAAATNVTTISARLNGTVTSGSIFSPITARFRFDTADPGTCNDSFGTLAPASGSSTIGGGGSFAETVTGLSPGTTYFYCAIASNLGGTTVGPVRSFETEVVTAAGVTIAGRVTSRRGRGILGAVLTISGGTLSKPLVVRTNTFGYYRFKEIRAGGSYVLEVRARRFVFASPTQILNVSDNVADANFTAN